MIVQNALDAPFTLEALPGFFVLSRHKQLERVSVVNLEHFLGRPAAMAGCCCTLASVAAQEKWVLMVILLTILWQCMQ